MNFFNLENIDLQTNLTIINTLRTFINDILEKRDSFATSKEKVQFIYENESTIVKNLSDILTNHFNIDIKVKHNPDIIFPHSIFTEFPEDTEINKRVSEIYNALPITADAEITSVDDIKQVIQHLNTVKGKMNINLPNVSAVIYLNFNMMFLLKNVYNEYLDDLNTDEIITYILSAVGYLFLILENIIDTYKKDYLETAYLKKLIVDNEIPVNKKIQNTRKLIKDTLKKNKTKELKPLNTFLQATDNFLTKVSELEEDTNMPNALAYVTNILIFIMTTAVTMVTGQFIAIANFTWEFIISGIFLYHKNISANKVSDMLSDPKSIFNVEKYIDEFVVKFGLSNAWLNTINKLKHKELLLIFKIDKDYKINSSVFMYMLMRISAIQLCGINVILRLLKGEDVFFARWKKMKIAAISYFKRTNVPDEIMDDYIKDFERLESDFLRAKLEHYFTFISVKLFETISWILKIPFNLFKHNIMQTASKLQENIEQLENNRLYYSSKKLEQLMRKK